MDSFGTVQIRVSYTPEELTDEFPNIGMDRPGDWLPENAPGSLVFLGHGSATLRRHLTQNEVISFCRKTHYGAALMTISDTGAFSSSREMPATAAFCRTSDEGIIATSLASLAEVIIETLGKRNAVDKSLEIYFYRTDYVRYRYDAAAKTFNPI